MKNRHLPQSFVVFAVCLWVFVGLGSFVGDFTTGERSTGAIIISSLFIFSLVLFVTLSVIKFVRGRAKR